MYFHKIWTWDWQDWHSSVFSVQVHITFPSRSTLKKLPDDNKSDCYVTSWRTIWLSQITFERCGVRRGGGRHVPGGNLKKPLTMMGLATVAVTTLRTLARLHTVRPAPCLHHRRLCWHDAFQPTRGTGAQLLSGTDEVHFQIVYCARKASKSCANYPQIKQ